MSNPPTIIDTNVQTVLSELIADYQVRTGRILQPAQVEYLLLNSWAYREGLIRSQIQNAATQNLVDFAVAPILDYLGALVGVTRLDAVEAQTTIRFTFVSGHGSGTIPAGTRVGTTDGKMHFYTTVEAEYTALDDYIDIPAICSLAGTTGNGYTTGSVSKLIDPIAVVSGTSNTSTTASGADQETDEQLRTRIKLAPSAFSTAGSKQAYIFHAKSAHPSITDVIVNSPTPGVVKIYPKVLGGDPTSEEVLDAVQQACSAEDVRPLTDTVQTESPSAVEYTIEVDLVLYSDADEDSTVEAVTDALQSLADAKNEAMGQDVLPEHIISACLKDLEDKIYSVDTNGFITVEVDETEFAKCTGITVNVTGTTNG